MGVLTTISPHASARPKSPFSRATPSRAPVAGSSPEATRRRGVRSKAAGSDCGRDRGVVRRELQRPRGDRAFERAATPCGSDRGVSGGAERPPLRSQRSDRAGRYGSATELLARGVLRPLRPHVLGLDLHRLSLRCVAAPARSPSFTVWLPGRWARVSAGAVSVVQSVTLTTVPSHGSSSHMRPASSSRMRVTGPRPSCSSQGTKRSATRSYSTRRATRWLMRS